MRDWFAVHTHAKAEFVAKANLERQGFGTYLPVFRKMRRHARRTELVSAPLFPRYIFVCLGRGTGGWSKIRYSRGVSNIVSFGLKPAIVSQDIVEGLWSREDEEGFVSFGEKDKVFPGDKVNIVEGFFERKSGVIEKISGKDRVLLLLDLIDRQIRLNTSRDCISLSV